MPPLKPVSAWPPRVRRPQSRSRACSAPGSGCTAPMPWRANRCIGIRARSRGRQPLSAIAAGASAPPGCARRPPTPARRKGRLHGKHGSRGRHQQFNGAARVSSARRSPASRSSSARASVGHGAATPTMIDVSGCRLAILRPARSFLRPTMPVLAAGDARIAQLEHRFAAIHAARRPRRGTWPFRRRGRRLRRTAISGSRCRHLPTKCASACPLLAHPFQRLRVPGPIMSSGNSAKASGFQSCGSSSAPR